MNSSDNQTFEQITLTNQLNPQLLYRTSLLPMSEINGSMVTFQSLMIYKQISELNYPGL